MRIALDAMGGDLAPKAAVEGAVLAARDFGIEVVLVGDREAVERELTEHDAQGLRLTVEEASETVTMDDSPLESVLAKPNSSIHVGFDLLKRREVDGFVSAGNSGAVMAAAMVILGNLPNLDRPAIASPIPTSGEDVILIDAGANTEVKPLNLVQFAVMGSVYLKRVRNIASPRVGILSNGEESSKGSELTRAAARMMEQLAPEINYVGYVEGRDINRSRANVVVTDGFTGNVALKTMEGFATFMLRNLFEVFGTSWRGRLGYFMVRRRLRAMRQRLEPHEYGGAPLLGVDGVVIIAHGASDPLAIRSAIRAASDEAQAGQIGAEITDLLRRIQPQLPQKNAGKGLRALFSRMRERLHLNPKESEPAPEPGTRPSPPPEAQDTDFAATLEDSPVSRPVELAPNGARPPTEPDAPGRPQSVGDHPGSADPAEPEARRGRDRESS